MTKTETTDGVDELVPPRRQRKRQSPARTRRMLLRLSEEEFEAITRAARDLGLTPTGYAARSAVRAAQRESAGDHSGPALPAGPVDAPVGALREALVELMQARIQVRRVGTNLNQAVMVLNATGDPPAGLAAAVAAAERAVEHLDQRSAQVARRIRQA